MNSNKNAARIIGLLLIIATVVNIIGTSLSKPFLSAPDYLIKMFENGNTIILSALLVVFSAFACAGIAICLYPILRKYSETLALASVVFRSIESLLYIIAVVCMLSLLTVSQSYVNTGVADTTAIQFSGTLLLAMKEWSGQLAVISFTIGGFMYYFVLYKTKLVPRFLSIWGILSTISSLFAVVLAILGVIVPFTPVFIILQLPIFVQEIVLAVWLIVKGFNTSVISESTKVSTN